MLGLGGVRAKCRVMFRVRDVDLRYGCEILGVKGRGWDGRRRWFVGFGLGLGFLEFCAFHLLKELFS